MENNFGSRLSRKIKHTKGCCSLYSSRGSVTLFSITHQNELMLNLSMYSPTHTIPFPSLFLERAKCWQRLHWEIRPRQLELPLITRRPQQKFDSQWFGILHSHHYCNETLNIYHTRVRGESFCPVSLRFWLIIAAHWVQHLLRCATDLRPLSTS